MTFVALNSPPEPMEQGQTFRTSHMARTMHTARYVTASSNPVGQYLHAWCGRWAVLPDHYQDHTTARVYSPTSHPCRDCTRKMNR